MFLDTFAQLDSTNSLQFTPLPNTRLLRREGLILRVPSTAITYINSFTVCISHVSLSQPSIRSFHRYPSLTSFSSHRPRRKLETFIPLTYLSHTSNHSRCLLYGPLPHVKLKNCPRNIQNFNYLTSTRER